MTTKTHYAMFAIAAIAAMSFGFTPAFAASSTQTVLTTADNHAYKNQPLCNGDNLITRVTPNSSSDYVKVVLDGDACSTFSSVSVTLYVDGGWAGSYTTTSDYKTIWMQHEVGLGDSVKVVTNWNY